MNYQESVNYLKSFINYEKSVFLSYPKDMRLDRVRALLDFLRLSYKDLKYIQVAGSKGKGSVCSMVSSILVRQGYKVGLFTSPHLNTMRERIRVFTPAHRFKILPDMQGLIQEDELCCLVEELKPKIDDFNGNEKYGKVTFFEIYTVFAIAYFLKKKVDFAVLEVGLGGRLDATTVVNPIVCGITSLSLEHTDKLGNTLKEIAYEKAGIIKENSIVITSPQHREAMEVIREKSKEKNAKLIEVGRDILYEHINSNAKGEFFNLKTFNHEFSHLEVSMIGEHQVTNAVTATAIAESLSFGKNYISAASIRQGLMNVSWPGRMDVLGLRPLIILDGAQNRASANALKRSILSRFNCNRLFLVLSLCKDKDIYGVCEELSIISDEIYLTKVRNPRSALPEEIFKKGKLDFKKVCFSGSSLEALNEILRKTQDNDLVLITGSLYLVGESRYFLNKKFNNLILK